MKNETKRYKKNHHFNHESDVEKSKIQRDRTSMRKIHFKVRACLNDMINCKADDELFDDYLQMVHQEKQYKKTYKQHKQRLNTIKNDID
jgi:hypothetical protein